MRCRSTRCRSQPCPGSSLSRLTIVSASFMSLSRRGARLRSRALASIRRRRTRVLLWSGVTVISAMPSGLSSRALRNAASRSLSPSSSSDRSASNSPVTERNTSGSNRLRTSGTIPGRSRASSRASRHDRLSASDDMISPGMPSEAGIASWSRSAAIMAARSSRSLRGTEDGVDRASRTSGAPRTSSMLRPDRKEMPSPLESRFHVP